MKLKITDSADSLAQASALLGISPDKIADRFLADTFCGQLEAEGTAFLIDLGMHPYSTRAAAEAVIERLEEQVIGESLQGNSKLLISAEVAEEDGPIGFARICFDPMGRDGDRILSLLICK
jgi:hypothetical protein